MEKYGTWYTRVVYKITRADYIKYKYYEKVDGSFAFWIIDDNNYFITDNIITGKIIETFDRTVVEDAIEEAGRVYYTAEECNDSAELSEADKILEGVYSAKLWDEI